MTPRHRPGLVQQRVQIVASHDLTLVVSQRGVEVYSLTQEVTKVRGKKGHAATAATPIRPEVLRGPDWKIRRN